MFRNPGDREISDILKKARNIAVVGLSGNKKKDSYRVAEYLAASGYVVIPVNPAAAEIMGRKSHPDLASVPEKIDIVNVFRRSEHLAGVVEEALSIKPQCIWSQQGVVDENAAARAAENGIPMVMDLCIKVEHRRLFKGSRGHESN